MMRKERVILITGASSGIGFACAQHLSSNGYQVFGTSRRNAPIDQRLHYRLIPLDVCSENAAAKVASSVVESAGRLDVLINNAGFGIAGPIEETPIAEIREQLEVNFYGLLRMCQAVIPIMRQQGEGLIINISSIAGVLSLPFQGAYCASKFAVEALTRAMRMELRRFNIRVTSVRPGDCRTDFTNRRRKLSVSEIYREPFSRVTERIEKNERNGMDPMRVAEVVEKIINRSSPRASYIVGSLTEKMAIFLQQILPSNYFERLLMGFYNMPNEKALPSPPSSSYKA